MSKSMLLLVFAAYYCVAVGCSKDRPRLNPLDPSTTNPAPTPTFTPTPTPYLQVLWKNGSLGTWFTKSLTLNTGFTAGSQAQIAATDNVNGDTQAIQLSSSGSYLSGEFHLDCVYSAWIGAYLPTGHLQFDIRLDRAASGFNYLSVGYANQHYIGGTEVNVLTQPGVAVGTFVHVSIPISSMTSPNNTTAIPVYFDWQTSCYCSGTLFTVNDIRWTP